MPAMVDQLLVLTAVLAAVGYLWWRSRRKQAGGCGKCAGASCGTAASQTGQPESGGLVQLETRPRRR